MISKVVARKMRVKCPLVFDRKGQGQIREGIYFSILGQDSWVFALLKVWTDWVRPKILYTSFG